MNRITSINDDPANWERHFLMCWDLPVGELSNDEMTRYQLALADCQRALEEHCEGT